MKRAASVHTRPALTAVALLVAVVHEVEQVAASQVGVGASARASIAGLVEVAP